ncbi:MAG: peptide ABC transporter substrate-binding protein [Brumimicrobium sp.]
MVFTYKRLLNQGLQLIVIVFIIYGMFACSGNDKLKFEHAGGTFSFPLKNMPVSHFPYNTIDIYSTTLLNQVYEGLVQRNPQTLQAEPSLASDWQVLDNGRKIQFTLRDDVYFHPHHAFDELIKLSPEDVVYSIELACTPVDGNKEPFSYSVIFKSQLIGAEDFYNGNADHIEGITVQGNVITLSLIEKDFDFIDKLALAQATIVSKEVSEAGYINDLIGTGPFKFNSYKEIDEGRTDIVLLRNENYYEVDNAGNQLPYLDSLVLVVEKSELKQLGYFQNDEIQLIESLPTSMISSMLGQGKIKEFNGTPPNLILIRNPLLGTSFIQFNLLEKALSDINVRKAINYAINRENIVQSILKNQAYGVGNAGLVPPAVFNGYNTKKVMENSYTFNPKLAKKLLADAGYPNGEGFPDISIKYVIGSRSSEVAKEISRQLEQNLNINVSMDGVDFKTLLEDQEKANGYLFMSGWFADYSSPEAFLFNSYGKNAPETASEPSQTNYTRYKNPQFDEIFENAKNANDIIEQYEYLAEAESIMMKDSPYIILWYEETIKVAYSKVRNLHLNAMNYYSLKDVYIKEWTKSEWEEKNIH